VPLLRVVPAVALVGVVALGVSLAGRSRPTRDVAEPVPSARVPVVAAPPAKHDAIDVRAAIRASVEAVLAAQRRGHALDVYLEDLVGTARAQGRVTALELIPGLEAIEAAYPGDMDRGPAFARRMEALQRELGQTNDDASEPPPGVTVASLLQAVESAPAGPSRDKLIPQALTAIGRLPDDEQAEASRALDAATAKP